MAFQMNNDDEWLMRKQELIGDDDFVLGGNLVRIPEEEVKRILSSPMNNENSELTDTIRQPVCEFPIEVINEQNFIQIDEDKIKFICSKIISDAGFRTGLLVVVLTDNMAIRVLNLKYLEHDYVTDVISFNLDCTNSHLEGETVASAELAKERCEEFGWDEESELLLYVIHGTLHQVGYDDQTENDAKLMRQKEAFYLRLLGIIVNSEDEEEEKTCFPTSENQSPLSKSAVLGKLEEKQEENQQVREQVYALRNRFPNGSHQIHVHDFQFLKRHP